MRSQWTSIDPATTGDLAGGNYCLFIIAQVSGTTNYILRRGDVSGWGQVCADQGKRAGEGCGWVGYTERLAAPGSLGARHSCLQLEILPCGEGMSQVGGEGQLFLLPLGRR